MAQVCRKMCGETLSSGAPLIGRFDMLFEEISNPQRLIGWPRTLCATTESHRESSLESTHQAQPELPLG
jgi:hypothetical protein